MYTLALETSCDETSAAVIEDGRHIRSNIISTQVPIHRKFGGVVPEIASRQHIEYVLPIIKEALDTAQVTLADIDHIGVTYGPGLVGALLVGVAAAKAISFAADKPLVGVNHMEGISLPISSAIPNWNRRSWPSSFLAAIHSWSRSMAIIRSTHGSDPRRRSRRGLRQNRPRHGLSLSGRSADRQIGQGR